MSDFQPLRSYKEVGSARWKKLNKAAEQRAKDTPAAVMPSLNHASLKDFDQVYEPSDDTYLLIDGIQADVTENSARYTQTFKNIIEIGCGSGIPIVYLAKLLPDAVPTAIDINPAALDFARRTAVENGVENLKTRKSDLVAELLPDMERQVDAIIFNPPYVPTPDEEVAGNGIEASWAGGERGRRVIDRAIPQIASLLSHPDGVCYLITVDDNEPEEIAAQFGKLGMEMKPLVRRRAHNEYLSVQKITPKLS